MPECRLKDDVCTKFSCFEYTNNSKFNTPEYRMLIRLRDELHPQYDNLAKKWKAMAKDLDARREDKNYIFKLVNRIKTDLGRIAELNEYESRMAETYPGFDLANCLSCGPKSKTETVLDDMPCEDLV